MLVCQQINTNTTQRSDSPLREFRFIPIQIGEELTQKCGISILQNGLPSGSHQRKQVVDIMNGEPVEKLVLASLACEGKSHR